MSTLRSHSPEARALLVLGLPLAGSHVAQVLVGTTDTLMVGWYGVTELAALSIGAAFFFLLFMAVTGFAWAAMPLIAEAVEQGDDVRVRRVTRMAFWLVTLFGLVSMVPLWFAEPLLRLLGQDPEVSRIAQDYLRVAAFSLLPHTWVMVFKSYLSAQERAGIVLWVTVATVPLNAALNYLLIFGHFGFPEMGVRGAGLATIVVAVAGAVALGIYSVSRFPQHQLFVRMWRADWDFLGRVFRLGWPIGITSVSEVGLFAMSGVLVGLIGTIELAAHGIALQIASVTFVMHLGLSQAATVRIGRAAARRSLPDMRMTARASLAMSAGMALLTMALFLLAPAPLVSLFLDPTAPERDQVLAVGILLLAMAAVFQLVDGGQVILLGLLRGVQDTQVPMYITTFSYWAIGVPCAYALGVWYGAAGVWVGLVVGLACAAALLMWRFWGHSVSAAPAAEA